MARTDRPQDPTVSGQRRRRPADFQFTGLGGHCGRAWRSAVPMSRSSAHRSTSTPPTGPGARFGPRALRSAAYDPGSYHLDLGLDIFEWLDVVDAGDAYCPHGQSARSHRNIEAKVTDVLRADAFPVIIGGDHSITYPAATAVAREVRLGQGRAAAFRRACRHRGQHRGQPALARHPDAPADRVRRHPRPQLRPGRTARLLAAASRFRLDARAGDDLAPDARRLGPRDPAGHRRRHRQGRRRLRLALPVGRHRRARSRVSPPAPAPRSRAG